MKCNVTRQNKLFLLIINSPNNCVMHCTIYYRFLIFSCKSQVLEEKEKKDEGDDEEEKEEELVEEEDNEEELEEVNSIFHTLHITLFLTFDFSEEY